MQSKIRTPLPLAKSEDEWEALLKHPPSKGPRGGMVVWVEGQECVKIPLTQGMHTIINREDYGMVGMFRWFASECAKDVFYAMAWMSGCTRMYLHRMICPSVLVDHKNRNSLDNRRNNLRPATKSLNACNAKLSVKNTSGFKGVTWSKHMNKWTAHIRLAGVAKNLGYFDDPAKAAQVFNEAAMIRDGQQITKGEQGVIVRIEQV